MLKQFIAKIFSRFGYTVVKGGYSRWRPNRWEPEYLRKLKFHPRTVIDVGVAYGTPDQSRNGLYASFPDAYFVLIEPLKEFEPYLQDILKNYKGIYLITALGSKEEIRVINVEPGWTERSSMFNRTSLELTGDSLSQREVPVTTLDILLGQHRFEPPFGLKIDTEGFEYRIIEGASDLLRHTEFVIAEVSVANRFEGGYSFADFIELMRSHHFHLCDILDIGTAGSHEITFIDAVFTRRVNR